MPEKTKIIAGIIIALIVIGVGVYVAFFWKPAPAPPPTAAEKVFHERVIILINNEWATRKQLFVTATADTVYVPAENIEEVNGTEYAGTPYRIEIKPRPDAPDYSIEFIVLNTYKEPFNDTLIRQALAWATPYEPIYETLMVGLMRPYWGVLPYGMPGWTDYGIIKYTFNLTKAQEIISQTDAYKQNKTYKFEIAYNLGNAIRASYATLLQNSWGQLVNMDGKPMFEISVTAYNWPVFLKKTAMGDFDVYTVGWLPDYVDPDNYAGPMFYGATKFSYLAVHDATTASEVAKYVAVGAKVVETPNYFVVVGENGTGFTPTQTGKPYIVVSYVVNETATPTIEYLMAEGQGFGLINAAFYRNVTADALIIAGRQYVVDPVEREAIYNAIHIISNWEVPLIWVGQPTPRITRWTWVEGHYLHPTLPIRWDLLYEYSDAPVQSVGIKDYKNDPSTYVTSTIGWPESLDPAASYETFGWNIFYQTGSQLLTYWKNETAEFTPDLGVAWAYSADKEWLYFVVRGDVVAYDPWNNKTYPIDASDVLFSLWRVARLRHPVAWMITEFIDVNASTWLTEEEFDNKIKAKGVFAAYRGQSKTIKEEGLSGLLDFFGYNGTTAHVVALKLYYPYPAILAILACPFTEVLPAEYVLGTNYSAAMTATDNGKDPRGYANYVGDFYKTDWTHKLVNEKPVSTGPYYLKEYVEDSYLVFEYNPYYWNKTLWKDLYGFEAETGTYMAKTSFIKPLLQLIAIPVDEELKLL
ncbi:MAG: ABC transporter substrate-binding protein [Candidatus Baldrarchaeia archaeon]